MNPTTWAPKRMEYDALFEAVSAGDLDGVKRAVSSDMDLDVVFGESGFGSGGDGDGETVLHQAAEAGDVEIVEYLLANGASVDSLNRAQFGPSSPLHSAARESQPRIVEVLLNHGADINARGDQGKSVIHQVLFGHSISFGSSVRPEQIETIKVLLDHGHNIDSFCLEARGTVLHQAAELDSLSLVQFLIERGASLSNSHYESPLCCAVSHNRYENAKFLLDCGAKVDKKALENPYSLEMMKLLLLHATDTTISGSRPLNAASRFGRLYVIPLLLEKKFDVNAIDEFGQTPLLAACKADRPCLAIVEMLLSHGADVMARSTSLYGGYLFRGDTSLHSTAWRSDVDVVQALLKAGADVNAKNYEGQTPLIKFALYLSQIVSAQVQEQINPRLQVFKMLIDGGADVSLVDNKHRTALHAVAISRKYGQRPLLFDAMTLLVDAGINLEAVDADGATVFDILSGLQAQDLIGSLSRYTSKIK